MVRFILALVTGAAGYFVGALAATGDYWSAIAAILVTISFGIWSLVTLLGKEEGSFGATGDPTRMWVAAFPSACVLAYLYAMYQHVCWCG